MNLLISRERTRVLLESLSRSPGGSQWPRSLSHLHRIFGTLSSSFRGNDMAFIAVLALLLLLFLVIIRALKYRRKGGSRVRRRNYTHHGTQVVIANGFNGFSVCFSCNRGLFVTEQSENNLRDTYVHPRKLFSTYECGNGGRGRISGHPVTSAALPTIHQVDINYSAVAEQFIGVIIVYRYFRRPRERQRGEIFQKFLSTDRSLSRAVISFH